MVSLDTLRADRLSCYGYDRLTSPHLDRMASQGSLFQTCIAPHIPTHPAHTTVFTGRDVFGHQIVAHGGRVDLDPGVPLLAERMRDAGYFTAAADDLGRWFQRGFDLYEGFSWDRSEPRWRKGEAVNGAADRVFAAIAAQDRPFFCFLHYWDVHTPYLPPDPFWGMFYDGDPRDPRNHSLDAMWAFEPFRWYFHEWMPGVTDVEFPRSQYDAALAYLDVCLLHMFTLMERRGLLRDTLVVIFADHGEELDEHSMWFDHHGLYETNIHVPLIVWCPGRVPARTVSAPVSQLDIAPTVLEAAGLPRKGLDGQSLWPHMRGEADAAPCEAVYVTECSWMRKHAWRTREWKLILALEPDFHHCPPVELYHLPSDPGERHNLAEHRPDVVAELSRALQAHVAARVAATGRPAPVEVQSITMRRIGHVRMAIAGGEGARREAAPEAAAAEPPAKAAEGTKGTEAARAGTAAKAARAGTAATAARAARAARAATATGRKPAEAQPDAGPAPAGRSAERRPAAAKGRGTAK